MCTSERKGMKRSLPSVCLSDMEKNDDDEVNSLVRKIAKVSAEDSMSNDSFSWTSTTVAPTASFKKNKQQHKSRMMMMNGPATTALEMMFLSEVSNSHPLIMTSLREDDLEKDNLAFPSLMMMSTTPGPTPMKLSKHQERLTTLAGRAA